MTVYQSQNNAYVAYKLQSGLGSQATGSGGTILRTAGGQGGRMTKAVTSSKEVRSDGMRTRGRHGTQKTNGSWDCEVSLGSIEEILQAIVRGTWDVSALSITQANFTSLTTTTSTIVGASGDMRTLGLRVGDVIQCTGLPDAANNGRNLRITGLTASTITVAETLTANASPDTTCSITRTKKLIQTTTPVKRYYTIDEYDVDIDQSEVMTDFVWGGFKFSMQPNGIIGVSLSGMGTGQFSALPTGSSPLLTSPGVTTSLPMAVVDATIRVNGNDLVSLSSFDLSGDNGATGGDVFGSAAQKYSPDVFTGQLGLSLNFTAMRKDLQYIQDFTSETQYELHVLMAENEAEPKDFISVYLGNLTLGDVAKSALSAQAGARTVSVSVPVDLIGADTRGTGYDPTMIKIQSTGA